VVCVYFVVLLSSLVSDYLCAVLLHGSMNSSASKLRALLRQRLQNCPRTRQRLRVCLRSCLPWRRLTSPRPCQRRCPRLCLPWHLLWTTSSTTAILNSTMAALPNGLVARSVFGSRVQPTHLRFSRALRPVTKRVRLLTIPPRTLTKDFTPSSIAASLEVM
jgi:hypothetical protein